MKKYTLLALLIVLIMTFVLSPALAATVNDPLGTEAPEVSHTAKQELIAYNSNGEAVVRIQLRLRELGYLNYKPTGNFQSMSVEATKHFQQKQVDDNGDPIIADGTVGEQSLKYLFAHGARQADITASIPIGAPLKGSPAITGELLSWSEADALLPVGKVCVIHDFNTGTQWSMKRTDGVNHAEMECAGADDSTVFRETFGGADSYFKRPVVVEIDGRHIAASLQGYPHGSDSIADNGMDGHACLFFNGSLSHVASWPDVEHQANVYKAAGRS